MGVFEAVQRGFEGLLNGFAGAGLNGTRPVAEGVCTDDPADYGARPTETTGNERGIRRVGNSGRISGCVSELCNAVGPAGFSIKELSLSKGGDNPINLISGDSLSSQRVREIMITLELADLVAKAADQPSPLRAILDAAQGDGTLDIVRGGFGVPGAGELSKISPEVAEIFEINGLGKISNSLLYPLIRDENLRSKVPYLQSRIVLNPDVVAIARSGIMVDGAGRGVLRNPERPERDAKFENKGIIDSLAPESRMNRLKPERVLECDESSLSGTGQDRIYLRDWTKNLLVADGDDGPYNWIKNPTDRVNSIKERFGPLAASLPAEEVRSVALRLEVLVPARELLENLYDYITKGSALTKHTALLVEAVGLGTTFYEGSSTPNSELGIKLKKGVVEVLLSAACEIREQGGDSFLGLRNPELPQDS